MFRIRSDPIICVIRIRFIISYGSGSLGVKFVSICRYILYIRKDNLPSVPDPLGSDNLGHPDPFYNLLRIRILPLLCGGLCYHADNTKFSYLYVRLLVTSGVCPDGKLFIVNVVFKKMFLLITAEGLLGSGSVKKSYGSGTLIFPLKYTVMSLVAMNHQSWISDVTKALVNVEENKLLWRTTA